MGGFCGYYDEHVLSIRTTNFLHHVKSVTFTGQLSVAWTVSTG
jgi:hypothetical protein